MRKKAIDELRKIVNRYLPDANPEVRDAELNRMYNEIDNSRPNKNKPLDFNCEEVYIKWH